MGKDKRSIVLPEFSIDGMDVPKPEDAGLDSPAPEDPSNLGKADVPETWDLPDFSEATTTGADPSAPPVMDAPEEKHPIGNDYIRHFIESRLNVGKQGIDPQLQHAQFEEFLQRGIHNLGQGMGNPGEKLVANARGFANAIAGHGFTPGEVSQPAPQPYDESQSPVKRYLAEKAAQRAQDQADLTAVKDAAQAGRYLDQTDPESLMGRKLALQEQEHERKVKQGDRGLDVREAGVGQKDRELDQGDTRNDLAAQKEADLQDFRKFQQKIGWARLSQQEKTRALAEYKAGQQDKRIAQRQETLNRDAQDRSISGEEGSFSKFEAKDLGQQKGNVAAAVSGIQRLKELRSDLLLNGALPTDKQAEFESLYHSLSPVLNGAEFKTAWNKAHGENFKEQLRSPRDLANWLNKDYFDRQADEVEHALTTNFKARVDAARKGPSIKPDQAAGVHTVPDRMSDEDKAALEWARANAKDPRAAKIFKRLKVAQ